VSFERWIQEHIEPVQSRIRQRSRHFAPDLGLVDFFGATGTFLTALAPARFFAAGLIFLGAIFFAIGFLIGWTLAFDADDLVTLAFGI